MFSQVNKEKEEQERMHAARTKLYEETLEAVKKAVPHPEYSKLWRNAVGLKGENMGGATQRARNMNQENREKVFSAEELVNESFTPEGPESQRIKSEERLALEKQLNAEFKNERMDDKYGNTYRTAINIAAHRGRNYEEAKAIINVIVLSAKSHNTSWMQTKNENKKARILRETEEFSEQYKAAVIELEKIREGLPKYVAPPPRDTDKDAAIRRLLAFRTDKTVEEKEELFTKLQAFSLAQIQKKIEQYEAKDAAAAAALAEEEKKKKGSWFWKKRTRKARKIRRVRTMKN